MNNTTNNTTTTTQTSTLPRGRWTFATGEQLRPYVADPTVMIDAAPRKGMADRMPKERGPYGRMMHSPGGFVVAVTRDGRRVLLSETGWVDVSILTFRLDYC